jgi:U3 small nucleolar RNA-associated protein 21
MAHGQVFVPFRSLGVVVNSVPFHLFSIKEDDFLALSTGKSYQVLGCKQLRLSRVGPAHAHKVRALAQFERFILATDGADIVVSSQSDVIKVLKGHQGTVQRLLVVGVFLLSIADDGKCIIWNLQSMTKQSEIIFPSDFHPSCIMHPDTYLNKVLVGSTEGIMALYNLRSKKLVYEFPTFGSHIICVTQSPVVDVVGVGLADGRIVIHNLKMDKTVMTFTQTEGAVTTLAFRSDKHALLCSGTPHGQIVLWDLTKRRLLNIFKAHHKGPVVHATFLHNEPVLVSAGSDNSIKMWIFDMGDQDTGRLLRSRIGHPDPPKVVRWFGPSFVITASGNCIRTQKVMSDGGNRDFGIASQSKKLHIQSLPPILEFAFNPIKQKEWDDVISCHENSVTAHTWSTHRSSLGSHQLVSSQRPPTPIKAVAISTCGNFGYIGTASGWIDKYNLQSGIHRAVSKSSDAHTAAIVGMCCDASNRYLISGSLDGYVKLWNTKLELEHTIEFGTPVNKLLLSPHSQLLAVACDDLVVRLYDIDAKRTVRKFIGHSNLITDAAFSPDERWLVTSSTDSTVRIWDIPTGKMIDWFAPQKTVTSLSFSPAGDFLATAHVNERAISIWSNKAYFTGVMLRAPPAIVPAVNLPTIKKASVADSDDTEDNFEGKEEDDSEEATSTVADHKRKRDEGDEEAEEREGVGRTAGVKAELNEALQLDEALITLSTTPKAKWLTLADLDQIKERNKGPNKATVPDMPFFIPTVASLHPDFNRDKTEIDLGNSANGTKSRIISLDRSKPLTKWMQLLADKNYSAAMELLAGLSPSGVDFELHSVPTTDNLAWFILVLKFFTHELNTNFRFELVQAYINRFLKIHNDVLTRHEVSIPLEKLLQTHKASWQRIESIFHSNLCLVNYFSNLHI